MYSMRLPSIIKRATVAFALVMSFMTVTVSAQIGINDGAIWQAPRMGGDAITEPSPEATAMRRYRDVPISYATGTADISIPLLEMPGGSAGVSIGLSYHTGGIKREELSTYIALGWTLTGLGSITRQIHGFPDEWRGDSYNPVVHDVRDDCSSIEYLTSIIEARTDAEHDIYYYNFPGYSGSFFISGNTIKQMPQTELIIEREADSSNNMATNTFTITTPEGSKFLFKDKEYIDFKINDSPRPSPYYSRDYNNAAVSWQLSKITGPGGIDETNITYYNRPGWTRYNYQKTYSDGFSYSLKYDAMSGTYGTYMADYTWGQNTISGTSQTTFLNQLIPNYVKTRSGQIKFRVTESKYGEPVFFYIDGLSCSGYNLDHARSIELSKSNFKDGRRRLDEILVRESTRDGDVVITERYTFEYNDASTEKGYDLFGYPNGRPELPGSHSIVDNQFGTAISRQPSTTEVYRNTLKSITDIAGVKTELDYEPATIDIGEKSRRDQLFHGNMIVGPRIRSITTRDLTNGTSRTRKFTYKQPACNIDLTALSFYDFLSYTGTHSISGANGYPAYHMGICHMSTLNSKGAPFENARIYYGRVTEILNDKYKTVFEYDLTNIRLNIAAGGFSWPPYEEFHPGPNQEQGRYLGVFDNFPLIGYNERRMLSYHSPMGYIDENIGGEPLLAKKTEYERVQYPSTFRPRREERNFYSIRDKKKLQVGVHSESRMFKYRGFNNSAYSLNIEDQSDIAFFHINITSLNTVKDSTIVTEFHDFNDTTLTRSIKTEFINSLHKLPQTPGFHIGLNPLGYDDIKSYPYGSITSFGDESVAYYRLLSGYKPTTYIPKSMKLLPITEKWIFTAAEGRDSIHRQYEYANFHGRTGSFIRPSRVSVSEFGATMNYHIFPKISEQQYSAYDSLGRITSMTDDQGRKITARWMDIFDLVTDITYNDVDLTTSYSHIPLTGCTSIASPSGKVQRFGYRGNRLVSELNTSGKLLRSYTYCLYGDGSEPGVNRFSTTVHDDSGESTDYTYYDAYGNAIRTISPSPNGKLIKVDMKYDDINRMTEQYLPIPSDFYYPNSPTDPLMQLMLYYNNGIPYKSIQYRDFRNDKPVSILRGGMEMIGHSDRFEYTCNLTDNAMLRCRRYRLANLHDSESVTLDGDYPPAALDVVKATDPDGCVLLTFTDWRGFKILERRVVDDKTFADTYWLYDIPGNVRVIIQPEGVAQMSSTSTVWTENDEVMEQFAFINRYDRRGNLVYAKTPSAGAVEMRYDTYNRLAFRSTATMCERGETEFTLYDPIGRVALCGISYNGIPDNDAPIPAMTTVYNQGGVEAGNTGYSCPDGLDLSDIAITAVNYYDSYECLSMTNRHSGFNDFMECAEFINLNIDSLNLDHQAVKGQLAAAYRGYYKAGDNKLGMSDYWQSIHTVYGYDTEGRPVTELSSTSSDLMYYLTRRRYSRQGYVTASVETLNTDEPFPCLKRTTRYDPLGNILEATAVLNDQEVTEPGTPNHPRYIYNDLGQLSQVDMGTSVQYGYNLRGQLSSITSPAFSQSLCYETGESPCYNGNISAMTISYGNNTPITRQYRYDSLNRLVGCKSSDGYDTGYTYNLNSSPLTVTRRGMTSDGTTGDIDLLTYRYDGNRVTSITDDADPVILEISMDFNSEASEYTYDADGALFSDSSRGISAIEYTPAGQPIKITDDNGDPMATYRYTPDGQKINSAVPRFPRMVPLTRFYVGPFELETPFFNDIYNGFNKINLPWGLMLRDGSVIPHMTDYQGNIRGLVNTANGNIEHTNDYYPYGTPMATSTGGYLQKRRFGGKELETTQGMNFHDFEARMLFNDRILFNRPDPMAYETPWLNPYMYCAANPIRYIDPSGEIWVERYYDGVREIFYDRDVYNKQDLETQDYYNDSRYSEVRALDDGETLNLGGVNYTFVNDSQENKYGSVVSDNKLLPNDKIIQGSNFDIFGTSDNSCDARSLHRNMMGTSYTGPNNPYTYEGKDKPSYQYLPRNMSEIPAIAHDKAYDNVGAVGFSGALLNSNPAVIEADYRFAVSNINTAFNNNSFKDAHRSSNAAFIFTNIAVFKTILFFHSIPSKIIKK